jgi:hypothetical protein
MNNHHSTYFKEFDIFFNKLFFLSAATGFNNSVSDSRQKIIFDDFINKLKGKIELNVDNTPELTEENWRSGTGYNEKQEYLFNKQQDRFKIIRGEKPQPPPQPAEPVSDHEAVSVEVNTQ